MSANKQPEKLSLIGLGELLRPTPSAVAKLLAAWNTLHTESQILVLERLCDTALPPHSAKLICLRALASPSAYVRYLASIGLCAKVQDAADRSRISAQIESDPEPLVRYAVFESAVRNGSPPQQLDDPESFFALPQAARLAIVRNLSGGGRQMARIVEHGLSHAAVSDDAILEILCDYLHSPRFRDHPSRHNQPDRHDGNAEWELAQELEALWQLVPLLPRSAAKLLLQTLPEPAGPGPGLRSELIDRLTDEQLIWLLDRPDIELKALRKDIALGHQRGNEAMRMSAMKHNFNLSYQEFAALVFDPSHLRACAANLAPLDQTDKAKIDTLQELARGGENLSPVFYEAMRDLLLETPLTIPGASQAVARARRRLHKWLMDHRDAHEDSERRALRLYRLAREAVPWNRHRKAYQPSGKLAFLARDVHEGDTWATFTAFCAVWQASSSMRLDPYLPRLHEIGETWTIEEDDENDTAKLVKATTQLAAKVDEALVILRRAQDQEMLQAHMRDLQKNLRRVEDEALASRKALEPINAWRKRAATVERIRMALFVLLTFLVLALLLSQVA